MRHVTLFVLLAVVSVTNVRAQDSLPVTVGDRVRVTAPDLGLNNYDGRLRLQDGSVLTVDTLDVPLTSVTELEVYRGKKGHTTELVLLGFLAGAGIGAAVAASDCAGGSQYASVCPAAGAAMGGLAGLFVGGITAEFIKSDRWEKVPLDQLRVSFVPQRDGRFAFGLSVAF